MAKCHWPFTTMVVLSDLTVVCGCTDPEKRRVLGDLNTQTVDEVWNGDIVKALRDAQRNHDIHPYCRECHLYHEPTQPTCSKYEDGVATGPLILQIEPCVRCNLRCPTAHCELNNQGGTRNADLMCLDDFKKIIDGAGPDVEVLRMYNYGESFLNRDVFKMIAYARQVRPKVYIDAHTNGLVFNTDEKIKALVECGLDYLIFSIDGAYQESYEKYRKGGQIDQALKAIRSVTAYRSKRGLDRPYICWRYILFAWNDSDQEMQKALEIAHEIGVDQFAWHLTTEGELSSVSPPGKQSLVGKIKHALRATLGVNDSVGSNNPDANIKDFSSPKYQPGSPSLEKIKHATWGFGGAGANALPSVYASGPEQSVRLFDAARFDVSDLAGGHYAPGDKIAVHVIVENVGNTTWRTALRPGQMGSARIGYRIFTSGDANPCAEGRVDINSEMRPTEKLALELTVYAPQAPGKYCLEIDAVREYKYWFAQNGSPPARVNFFVNPQ